MDLAEKILNRFPLSKPQRKFLLTLFTAILSCGESQLPEPEPLQRDFGEDLLSSI